jgi:hypothetical protein
MRTLISVSLGLVLLGACSEPECMPQERKVGTTCYLIPVRGSDAAVPGTPLMQDAAASSGSRAALDGSLDAESESGAADRAEPDKADAATQLASEDGGSCPACAAAPLEPCKLTDHASPAALDSGVCRLWYRDCDEDGVAASKEGRILASAEPAELLDCFGWTELEPTGADDTDCDDQSAARHPGAAPGLPISLGSSQLPPRDDLAYDLNCDGVPTPTSGSGTGLSTGKLKQGQLELIALCGDPLSCVGVSVPCIMSWNFIGVPRCGVPYGSSSDFQCVATSSAYYLCN